MMRLIIIIIFFYSCSPSIILNNKKEVYILDTGSIVTEKQVEELKYISYDYNLYEKGEIKKVENRYYNGTKSDLGNFKLLREVNYFLSKDENKDDIIKSYRNNKQIPDTNQTIPIYFCELENFANYSFLKRSYISKENNNLIEFLDSNVVTIIIDSLNRIIGKKTLLKYKVKNYPRYNTLVKYYYNNENQLILRRKNNDYEILSKEGGISIECKKEDFEIYKKTMFPFENLEYFVSDSIVPQQNQNLYSPKNYFNDTIVIYSNSGTRMKLADISSVYRYSKRFYNNKKLVKIVDYINNETENITYYVNSNIDFLNFIDNTIDTFKYKHIVVETINKCNIEKLEFFYVSNKLQGKKRFFYNFNNQLICKDRFTIPEDSIPNYSLTEKFFYDNQGLLKFETRYNSNGEVSSFEYFLGNTLFNLKRVKSKLHDESLRINKEVIFFNLDFYRTAQNNK